GRHGVSVLMGCLRRFLFWVMLLVLAPPALGEERGPARRLVVYSLRAEPELEDLAQRITDALLVHLGKRSDVGVLGEAEMRLILSDLQEEADLSNEDCRRAEECLVRLSQAADAEQMLVGRLGRLGDSYVVTLSLMNTARAIVERSDTCSADDEGGLR